MMNTIILKYGIYSFVLLPIMMVGSHLIIDSTNFAAHEVLGYLAMIIASLIAMIGVANYRKEAMNDEMSYWVAVKVGILILIIPSLLFGVFDLVYVNYIDPDFMENYYSYYVEQMRSGMSASKFEVALKEIEVQKEFFSNPFMSFIVMSSTMFLVGLVVSLISSFFLKTSK